MKKRGNKRHPSKIGNKIMPKRRYGFSYYAPSNKCDPRYRDMPEDLKAINSRRKKRGNIRYKYNPDRVFKVIEELMHTYIPRGTDKPHTTSALKVMLNKRYSLSRLNSYVRGRLFARYSPLWRDSSVIVYEVDSEYKASFRGVSVLTVDGSKKKIFHPGDEAIVVVDLLEELKDSVLTKTSKPDKEREIKPWQKYKKIKAKKKDCKKRNAYKRPRDMHLLGSEEA